MNAGFRRVFASRCALLEGTNRQARGNRLFSARKWGRPALLALILAASFLLRVHEAHALPWYTDEGLFADVTRHLLAGMPSGNCLKENGFFPLTAGLLDPLLGSVAVKFSGLAALPALRLWSALLGTGVCALLAWLGATMKDRNLGLAAAACYSLLPMAVHLDGMAFYHHAAVDMELACCVLCLRFLADGKALSYLAASLLAGIAAASAYYLFWLLPLVLAAAWYRRKATLLAPGLALMVLPLGVQAALAYSLDPTSFRAEVGFILFQAHSRFPFALRLLGVFKTLQAFPCLPAGMTGLIWLACVGRRRDGRWPWVLAFAVACSVEAFRQRANLSMFPFPLILSLPWVGLGLAALALAALRLAGRPEKPGLARPLASVALLATFAAGLLARPAFGEITALSAPIRQAEAMLGFLGTRLKPGDLVIGQASFNWALPAGVSGTEFDVMAAYRGRESDFFPTDYLPGRFTRPLPLADCRFFVMSSYQYLQFQAPFARRQVLEMERQAWPMVWTDGYYRVYGNPAFGVRPAARPDLILGDGGLYDQAALEAWRRGDLALARFAFRRGLNFPAHRDWRLRQLALLDRAARGRR